MEGKEQFGRSAGTPFTPPNRHGGQLAWKTQAEAGHTKTRAGDVELSNCRHLGSFFDTDNQRQALLRAFVVQGLRQRERVILIQDEHTGSSDLSHANLVGIDLLSCTVPGQLRIFTAHQTFLQQGYFDPRRVIAWLKRENRMAEVDGYSALRIAADMSWALHGIDGSDRLIDYETELDAFLSGRQCRILCQYDARRFPPAVLQHALTTHPTVVVGGAVCRNSYYRIAPSGFGDGPASATLGRWLTDLSTHNLALVP